MYKLNDEKLCLSGWLKENNSKEYDTPLKLQKFLFLYEMFKEKEEKQGNFNSLKGYKNGPVYSDIYGAYTKERDKFDVEVINKYKTKGEKLINVSRARKIAFIIKSLSERELSDLTHKMNIWDCKKDRILSGEKQVPLSKMDITSDDLSILDMLTAIYSTELIESSEIIDINNNHFIFSKEDAKRITESHIDTLMDLSEKEKLNNPIFVEIGEDGVLNVD